MSGNQQSASSDAYQCVGECMKKEFVATHTYLMPVKTKNKNVHRANDPATTEKNLKHDMENYNAYVTSIFPSPLNIVNHERRNAIEKKFISS